MNVESVSLFLALLAVLAEAGVVVAVILAVGGHVSSRIGDARSAVARMVGDQALGLAFVVAAVAMAGSLYFSEVASFPPCRLCWYQRIAMYPLVPLLGIAAVRRDRGIAPYAAALAGVGALISAYHVLLERYPSLESSVCEPTNPCTLIWVRRFGYLTIPAMALSGFAVILALLAVAAATRTSADDLTTARTSPIPPPEGHQREPHPHEAPHP
jgi:disulfide bond formation protein DsbB